MPHPTTTAPTPARDSPPRIVYRIRAPVVEIVRVFEGHMPLPQLDE